jgi:hypothetical protein
MPMAPVPPKSLDLADQQTGCGINWPRVLVIYLPVMARRDTRARRHTLGWQPNDPIPLSERAYG